MALDINNIQITGNLGADPEVKFYEEGTVSVTSFTVAQYVGAKDKDDNNVPKWWNVRFRSKLSADGKYKTVAEDAAELKKGNKIVIDGRISGWVPDSEYDKAAKEPDYKVQAVLWIEGNTFQKIDVPPRGASREQMPPM